MSMCFSFCFECYHSTLCYTVAVVLCFMLLNFYSDFSNWCYFIVLYNCMSLIFWPATLYFLCFMHIFMWSVWLRVIWCCWPNVKLIYEQPLCVLGDYLFVGSFTVYCNLIQSFILFASSCALSALFILI